VTVGAPLDTLYAHFLALTAPPPAGAEWWNSHRSSDFVGGPIAAGPGNAPAEQRRARDDRRDHSGYWSEGEIPAAALGTETLDRASARASVLEPRSRPGYDGVTSHGLRREGDAWFEN
jgi:hypothetical protein